MVNCNDSDFLRKLGECYKKLLLVGNKAGHNPYPNAYICPTRYFVMLYKTKVSLGIPENLDKQIRELMDSVDASEFEESMKNSLPIKKQSHFVYGMMKASKTGEK